MGTYTNMLLKLLQTNPDVSGEIKCITLCVIMDAKGDQCIYVVSNMSLLTLDNYWLVVEPTHLKHISQHGNLPQVGVIIKHI